MTNSRVEMLVRLSCMFSQVRDPKDITVENIVSDFKDVIPAEFMYDVINFMRQDEQITLTPSKDGKRVITLTQKGASIAVTDEKLIERAKELWII